MTLWVTTYLSTEITTREKLVETYPRHRVYLDEFAKGGQLIYIGTFTDAGSPGSMAVFKTEEAANDFLSGDPFVLEGLARCDGPREWNALEY